MKNGKEAVETVGFPWEFAEQSVLAAKTYGALAFRSGEAYHWYELDSSPKPLTIKEKTVNWGPHAGVIPKNYNALGKTKNGKVIDTPLHRHLDQNYITLEQPFSKILEKINKGLFEFISPFIFRSLESQRPENSTFEFQMVFSHPVKNTLGKRAQRLEQPTWWNTHEHGNFDSLLSAYYTLHYRQDPQQAFRPIEILADKNNLPITGDVDPFWIAYPSILMIYEEVHTVYNTFKNEELKNLLGVLDKIKKEIASLPDVSPEHLDHALLARQGCITAYEYAVIEAINRNFSNADNIPRLRYLIQHGCENNNPGPVSPLDAPILHFWKDPSGEVKIILTENEKELVSFVTQIDYLKHYVPKIHEAWDMARNGEELWAKPLRMQIKLGHPIHEGVLKKYTAYLTQQKNKSNDIALKELHAYTIKRKQKKAAVPSNKMKVPPPPTRWSGGNQDGET